MGTAARRKPATYEDLLAVPDHLVAEILDGELFAPPRPAFPHPRVSSGWGALLFGSFDRPAGGGDEPGGWWIVYEPDSET